MILSKLFCKHKWKTHAKEKYEWTEPKFYTHEDCWEGQWRDVEYSEIIEVLICEECGELKKDKLLMITLKTLHTATAQEVFDQAVNHLRSQNKRAALNPDTLSRGCRYRTEDGLKCAAGCFIADDEYKPEMEGKSWVGYEGFFPEVHKELIRKLQIVHDDYHPKDWENQFKELASRSNLVFKPLEA